MQSLPLQKNAPSNAAALVSQVAGKNPPAIIGTMQCCMMNLEHRMARLEQEGRTLRNSLAECARVQAPFRVVGISGRPLLSVWETERGAEITLYDVAGGIIVVLGQAPNGGNGIAIYNSAGERVAGLYADWEGGHLALYDNDGRGVAGIRASSDGGYLSVRNNEGAHHVSLLTATDGAILGFFDGGVPVLTLPERPEG